MSKRLLILGAGGHGKVVADAAMCQGKWEEIYFVDDRYPSLAAVMEIEVISKTSAIKQFCDQDSEVIVAIGDNQVRQRLQEYAVNQDISIATVVHPNAVIAKSAEIGVGCVVFAGAVINSEATIGQGVIINTGAIIEHDCVVGDWTHICPKVGCAGGAQIGSHVWVGIGANVIQNVNIGDYAVIGAGSVVLKAVEKHQQVIGVPAKERV